MVIKNCEDKYTYLFRVTKGLKTINAKTTTFSGSRFLVVFFFHLNFTKVRALAKTTKYYMCNK